MGLTVRQRASSGSRSRLSGVASLWSGGLGIMALVLSNQPLQFILYERNPDA